MSVASVAVGGVRTAYNVLSEAAPHFDYDWAGTAYWTAADLTAAVPGQGQHDIDATLTSAGIPPEGSPLIDSADAQGGPMSRIRLPSGTANHGMTQGLSRAG